MGIAEEGLLDQQPCKMWRTIAILSVAFLATCQADLDCREFTFNRCDFSKLDDLVSTTFGEDDSYCQFICKFLQADHCLFWVYDYPNSKCDIYGMNSTTDFGTICHDHGGPALPTIDDCKTNENKCKGFRYAQCDYKGEIIKAYANVPSENVCQIACEKAKDCQYYIYSPKDKVCELIVNKERSCNSLIGSPDPDLSECALQQNSVFQKLYYHYHD